MRGERERQREGRRILSVSRPFAAGTSKAEVIPPPPPIHESILRTSKFCVSSANPAKYLYA